MITVSHGCYEGPALEFLGWRAALCSAAHIPLTRMEIEGGHLTIPDINYGDFTFDNTLGEWEQGFPADDPVYIILVHSDEEGIIPCDLCELLANRLDELAVAMDQTDLDHDAQITRQFADGLRRAAVAQENVWFEAKED